VLTNTGATITDDLDGCQSWIIDDAVEGNSGCRFDPILGLPVCNGQYPQSKMFGNSPSRTPSLRHWITGSIIAD